jgi:endonuclease/exonuclease/phosphatase family metal-dependent hydrolase
MSTRKELHRLYLTFWHESTLTERLLFGGIVLGVLALMVYIALASLFAGASLDAPLNEIDAGRGSGSGNGGNSSHTLRVGTYNLWNFNALWDVRRQRIGELLDELDFDVIGFQEVRRRDGSSASQLDQLVSVARRRFTTALLAESSHLADGTYEGVALLSRYRALATSQYMFQHLPTDRDAVNRTCLRVLLDTPGGPVNVFVAHLSYERPQQCQNFLELKRFMLRPDHLPGVVPQILVGDLNVYTDFQHPLEILTLRDIAPSNPCLTTLRNATQRIMRVQAEGTVTLRNIGTNLFLSAANQMPNGTLVPRAYNLSRTLFFSRESVAEPGLGEQWRLSMRDPQSALGPAYSLSSTMDGPSALLAYEPDGDPHVRVTGLTVDQRGSRAQSWFIERVDLVAIRAFLAAEREPAALVLFDYVPRVDTELPIVTGQLVTLVDTSHADWWKVRRNNRIGYVPSNFIERIDFLPSCPPLWSEASCRKNMQLVRLRSAWDTYLHTRIDIEPDNVTSNEDEEAAALSYRRGVAHLLVDAVSAPQPELFMMVYDPPIAVSDAEILDDHNDTSIEHAYHAHSVNEVLDSAHVLKDVWRMLHPHDPGFTFSLLPFVDWEHQQASAGRTQRPDLILLHQHAGAHGCLVPVAAKVFGDDSHMAVHFFGQILWNRLRAYLFPVAPHGSIEPTDGVRLFHSSLKALTSHEMRFIVAFYVLLSVWMSYCVRARSSMCLCVGVALVFVPLWYSLWVVLAYGNPDELVPSDHAGVLADFEWRTTGCED